MSSARPCGGSKVKTGGTMAVAVGDGRGVGVWLGTAVGKLMDVAVMVAVGG